MKGLLGQLEALFEHLLLQTNGDVDKALEWVQRIGEHHHVWMDGFTFEDFKSYLEKRKLVQRDPKGGLTLSKVGERSLRASSLDAIFSNLRSGGAGDHRVASPGVGAERLPETRPSSFRNTV